MRVLVLPRDRNPYQGLLYAEMQDLGVQVTYLGELTPSRTINLLLLPAELGARRLTGARIIHLHWVFTFALPGARRLRLMRWLAQVWFGVWLRTCRALGLHLVWTVHNVLPHEPVFADDVAARRALVRASDLVLAHSKSALADLAALGAVARRTAVIQHGPIGPSSPAALLRSPGADSAPRRFLFFGSVQAYKGVDDLIDAFAALPDEIAAELTVAGQCDDPELRSRLHALARGTRGHVALRLDRVPEEEMTRLLAAADVVVLPYRRVTTSGSVMMALGHGRPLIVPDLAGLSELPDQAVLRYDGQTPALTAALARLAVADGGTLAAMSAAAGAYALRTTWREIAELTIAEMISVTGHAPRASDRRRPVRAP